MSDALLAAHPIHVTGAEIGDMIRFWEAQNGRISERKWSAAFAAAREAAHLGHDATRAAIRRVLTSH